MAGPTRQELKEELKKEKPYVPPSPGKDRKEADIFREGMKPPSPDEGPTKPAKKAKGGTVKKYADGGMTQQPTYPFYANQAPQNPTQSSATGGVNQTFNMQPQATAGQVPSTEQQTFKRGGKVSSASSRGDGIAQRGKTRGRIY